MPWAVKSHLTVFLLESMILNALGGKKTKMSIQLFFLFESMILDVLGGKILKYMNLGALDGKETIHMPIQLFFLLEYMILCA